MRCPVCQCPDNRVLESRSAESGHSVRRRRECLQCNHRFTTYERIEFVPIVVIKQSGDRESFDRSKVLRGIVRACEKTGIATVRLENMVEEHRDGTPAKSRARSPTAAKLASWWLKHLRKLNEVAYIRFASVYKQFRGIRDFVETLDHLKESADQLDDSEAALEDDEETDAAIADHDRMVTSSSRLASIRHAELIVCRAGIVYRARLSGDRFLWRSLIDKECYKGDLIATGIRLSWFLLGSEKN